MEKSSYDYYANYNNNLYWTIEIVNGLKVHHCMFYDQITHRSESLLSGLNSQLTAIKMNLPARNAYRKWKDSERMMNLT